MACCTEARAERGTVEAAAAVVAPPGTYAEELAALDERRAEAFAKIVEAQQFDGD